MSEFSVVVNAPYLYVNGLSYKWTSTTALTVNPGQCRDATNSADMFFPESLDIDLTLKGPGGLDINTLVANSQYSIYVITTIGNTLPPAAIASLSSNPYPDMGRYQLYRRIGYFTTNATPVVNTYLMSGNNNDKIINLDQQVILLSTTPNAPNFATLPLGLNFPPTSGMAAYMAILGVTSGSPANPLVCGIRGTGSIGAFVNTACFATHNASNNGAIGIGYQTSPAPVVTGGLVPSIDYSCNSVVQIRLAGWIDSL